MPTSFIKGDLFEDAKGPDRYALAFPADCRGEMDQGVASAFKKRWPALAEAYRARAGEKGLPLGELFAWQASDVTVYALGIARGDAKPSLGSFVRAVEAMVARAEADGIYRIVMARIGGLDPVRVKRVLTDAGQNTALNIVVVEQFVRAKPPAPEE